MPHAEPKPRVIPNRRGRKGTSAAMTEDQMGPYMNYGGEMEEPPARRRAVPKRRPRRK